MLLKIDNSLFQCVEVLLSKVGLRNTAVVLERTNRCDKDNRIRLQICHPALDIKELLSSQISTKSCLGDRDVR